MAKMSVGNLVWKHPAIRWLGLIAAVALMTLIFSRILAPGYDYYVYYNNAIHDLWHGQFSYADVTFRNGPWALIVLAPLGLLPPDLAQALLITLTFVVLAWAMWDYRRFKLSYALAAISAPMFAVMWLGQIEVFSLLGAIIGYRAVVRRQSGLMALALLLLAVKPQETWLIIGMLLIDMRRWSLRSWLAVIGSVAIVIVSSSLWLGWGWVQELISGPSQYIGQWQNVSAWRLIEAWPPLLVGLLLFGLVSMTVWGTWRAGVSRLGLGLAATASNLLSPYLTAPHLLMTMSLGWGEEFDRHPKAGAAIYLASLTPLLRLVNADQDLNRLDLIFPLLVFIVLFVRSATRRSERNGSSDGF
jgi:hypothetical protein